MEKHCKVSVTGLETQSNSKSNFIVAIVHLFSKFIFGLSSGFCQHDYYRVSSSTSLFCLCLETQTERKIKNCLGNRRAELCTTILSFRSGNTALPDHAMFVA